MKITSVILFYLCSTIWLAAQNYHDLQLTRDIPQKSILRIETITEKDTLSLAPFLSTIKKYDTEGMLQWSCKLNLHGDTLSTIKILYPSPYIEKVVYKDFGPREKTIATYRYNEVGFLQKETWTSSSDHETDRMLYLYNSENKLIRKTTTYSFGRFIDTLIYKKGKLHKVFSRDADDAKQIDSAIYSYDSFGFIQKIDKYGKGELIEYDLFEVDSNGRTLSEHSVYIYKALYSQSVFHTSFSYNLDGVLKESTSTFHSGERLLWTSTKGYDNKGNIISHLWVDGKTGGEVLNISKIIYNN